MQIHTDYFDSGTGDYLWVHCANVLEFEPSELNIRKNYIGFVS